MSSVHDAPHPRSRSFSGLVMVEPSIKLLYDEVIEGPLRDQFRIWGMFVELSKMVCFPYTTISNRRISSYSMLGKPPLKDHCLSGRLYKDSPMQMVQAL